MRRGAFGEKRWDQKGVPTISGKQVHQKRPPPKTLGQPLFRDGTPNAKIIGKSITFAVSVLFLGCIFTSICPVPISHFRLPSNSKPKTLLDSKNNPDLAILDASGGSRVLALQPTGLAALLQQASLVEHQHRLLIAQVFDYLGAQIIAYQIGLPVRSRQKVLHPSGV